MSGKFPYLKKEAFLKAAIRNAHAIGGGPWGAKGGPAFTCANPPARPVAESKTKRRRSAFVEERALFKAALQRAGDKYIASFEVGTYNRACTRMHGHAEALGFRVKTRVTGSTTINVFRL